MGDGDIKLLDDAFFTNDEIEALRILEFPQGVEKPNLPKDVYGRELQWYGDMSDEVVAFSDTHMSETSQKQYYGQNGIREKIWKSEL